MFLTCRREAPFRCSSNVETPSTVTPSLRTTASAMSTPNLNTETQDVVTQIMSTKSMNTQILSTPSMNTQILSTPSVSMQILSTTSMSLQNVNQHTNYASKNSFQIAILIVSVFLYTVVVV